MTSTYQFAGFGGNGEGMVPDKSLSWRNLEAESQVKTVVFDRPGTHNSDTISNKPNSEGNEPLNLLLLRRLGAEKVNR